MMFRMSVLKRESTWSESGDPVLHTLNQLSTQRRETAECREEVYSPWRLRKFGASLGSIRTKRIPYFRTVKY